MNSFTVWNLVFVLLLGYAGGTTLWYFFKIRPRLRALAATVPGEDQAAAMPGAPNPPAAPGAELAPSPAQALNEWQTTFDAVMDPILILDPNLVLVRGNRAAHALLSVNGSVIEGRACHQLFAGTDLPCGVCPVEVVNRVNKAHQQEINHRYLGRTFTVSCSPIRQGEQSIGFILWMRDISHQCNLEKRLLHTSKLEAIATLAGGIAHDFNNILGAILGNADLLLYRLPATASEERQPIGPPITVDEIAEHLQAIKRAGNRAKDLVAQILAFSRQTANQRKNLLVGPVVKEVCRLLRASLPATIELKVSVASEIGMIYADPSQIQQMLMILCTNASQAMEKNAGLIEITLREIETGKAEQQRYNNLIPGKYVALTVKDSGKGIPETTLERIFDPFFTTREVGGGTGMGLAVLHGILVSHDGVIDVKSEMGRGSVFTVFFPRVEPTGDDEGLEIVSMPHGTETILFVDDEEDIVKMRTRMLSYLGYRLLPATSPEQALGYLSSGRERIDLLITDHTMPRMTGLQLATEVSSLHPGLPIILCSGYSEAVTTEEAAKAGVSRFLAKPVDMRQLAIAIREVLPNQDRGE